MANIDDQGRPEPALAVSELQTLLGFLDFHRATLEWKTRGLTTEQLRRSIGASSMTLGGLLMHVAYVEDHWFVGVVHDRDRMPPWSTVDWTATPDWEWDVAHTMSADAIRNQWTTSVERCRVAFDEALRAGNPDALSTFALRARPSGERVSLRWILVHMIEEYARHNGHADLLREAIDGQTGE